MDETPKLHGWITPEYAMEMHCDLTNYLVKTGYKEFIDCFVEGWIENCLFTTTNVPNVT